MILAFKILCLLVTVFTIWLSLVVGEHSRAHRLMSMVLLLVFFFNVLEILEIVSGQFVICRFVEYLLITQNLYLLFFYILEYHEINLNALSGILLAVLTITDGALVMSFGNERRINTILELYMAFFYLMIIVAAILPRIMFRYSNRELSVALTLTAAFFIPLIGILLQVVYHIDDGTMVSACFLITMLIIIYLLFTGKMGDSRLIVGDRVYSDSPIATALFDEDMFFMGINTSGQELFAEAIADVVGNEADIRHENVQRLVAEFISDKNDGDVFEYEGKFYRWTSRTIYSKKKIRGYVMQMIDVTGEVNELKKVALLKEKAEKENENKALFLAQSTHDLRTPLHAILGVSDILMTRDYLRHEDKKLVTYISATGNSLMRIVNSILDYSKLEAGLFKLASREYKILPVLSELLQMCIINLNSKSVAVRMSITTEYPEIIVGDELRIKEMIQNILSNAIKFTDEGSIDCDISYSIQDGDTVCMKCVIKDTGAGMDKKTLDTIFEPYESDAINKKKEGTGIGMSVLKSLAEMMGGNAWAYSDGKNGSEVGFTILQKYKGQEMNEAVCLDNLKMETDGGVLAQVVKPGFVYPKARVLLADDIDMNREIFYNLTKPWKFILEEVADGDEAVEMVRHTHYDLIILDYFMPRMLGTLAAKEIREICDTPLVLMSANVQGEDAEKYEAEGFAAVLSKPLNMNDVRNVIEMLLPEDLRLAPDMSSGMDERALNFSVLKRKRRTYALYAEEVRGLIKSIENDYYKNIDTFRVKVHGNKGSSKNIGKHQMAYYSEVMEMAAKADHRMFIEENLGGYVDELRGVLDEVNKNIEHMDRMIENEKSAASVSVAESTSELFSQLKKGFETYNMVLLEQTKDRLALKELSPEEKQLLDAAIKDIYEFEYEHGASLFENT